MIIEHSKAIGDSVSIGALVGTMVGKLPEIAAFFTILWTLIRIYETKTIQKLIDRMRQKK